MGPDDDDLEEHEPLPDPTMRTWRHPSELAAVAAMAAREDEAQRAPRRLSLLSVLLGGAVGAGLALVAVGAVTMMSGEPASTRFALRDPSTTTASPTTTTAAPTSGAPSTTLAAATTAPTPPPTTAAATTVPTALDQTSTVATDAVVPIGDELPAADLPAVPGEAVVGVVLSGDAGQPRCTGLVLEGHVVTSASALGDADVVTLVVAGGTFEGTVVARDRFTDVAVISTDPAAPLAELPPAGPVAPEAAVALVATDGRPEPIAVIGRVRATGQLGRASDGHGLLGLVTTSARLPEPGAGALLLTAEGLLAGMVVDGSGHVASAVPEPMLRAVVRSLLDTGRPVPVWVGVSAVEADDGAVRLHGVVAGGPAQAAGLRAGDVVRSIDGAPVEGLAGFMAAIRLRQPGDVLAVTVDRRGAERAIELVLGQHPVPPADELAVDVG